MSQVQFAFGYPVPPDGNAPVYFGVGETKTTAIYSLVNRSDDPGLGFEVELSPATQRVHIAYPAAWGKAKFVVDDFVQTGAFDDGAIMQIAGVTCRVYSSNQRLRATNITISLE
jgi:hypothetical protein